MAPKHSSLGDRAKPFLKNEMKMVISQEDHTVSTLYSCPRRRPRSDMEGAALLRLFVLCIWTSGLFLGVGVRAEEAAARVQQNHPGGTDTGDPQESNISLEDYLNYFQKNVSPQELLLLLSDHKAWERVVATAELPRDEADELYKALNKLIRHMVMKDKNWLEEVQQHRKRFLEEFPRLERELQDKIRRLCDLAGTWDVSRDHPSGDSKDLVTTNRAQLHHRHYRKSHPGCLQLQRRGLGPKSWVQTKFQPLRRQTQLQPLRRRQALKLLWKRYGDITTTI
uniref:Uncharacterized protein n=1 Tax=Macaca fascicularis TaxID=9541 RepID=A0A7N9CGX8_MACFA